MGATINRYPCGERESSEQKEVSMARRTGRPRINLEENILKQMSANDKRLGAIIEEKLESSESSPWRMACAAAWLRLILEKGTPFQKARCEPLIKKLRETEWARAFDPRKELSDDCKFLECFIEAHAPGFDWREDARQGEIETQNYKRENERIAKDIAEDERWRLARSTKSHTPDVPDAGLLCALGWESHSKKPSNEEFERLGWSAWKHWLVTRKTWPTLRELKLATAIREPELKKIITDLRPKKGEIIKQSLRHKFSGCGAMPRRYGPRLVIGVLNEFVNRLSEFPIADKEREELRKTVLSVKRAFAAKLGHSR
jgi:hypothetical protein